MHVNSKLPPSRNVGLFMYHVYTGVQAIINLFPKRSRLLFSLYLAVYF